MNPATSTHFLVKLAEHPAFVLGAYFFAFLPWAVISNIDFISEKWRTVKRTRRNARIHLASYMIPVIYVGIYADAQRRTRDYKELGAALVALMFNLLQFLRTLMGIVQLDAFVAWCKHASNCIHVLDNWHKKIPDPKKPWHSRITRTITMAVSFAVYNLIRFVSIVIMINQIVTCVQWFKRKFDCVWAKPEEEEPFLSNVTYDIEELLMVNNTVVDNELGGRDVTVVPSIKKIWQGLKEGMLQPSRCLSTDQVELCTLRWGAAYLCAMDDDWGLPSFSWHIKSTEWFLSEDLRHCRRFFQEVHWNLGTENEYSTTDSHSSQYLSSEEKVGDLITAYGSGIEREDLFNLKFLESYSFEFDSLVGSYPGKNPDYKNVTTNRENVALGLVQSVAQAKSFGVEKLKRTKDYYDRYHVPNGTPLRRALSILINTVSPDVCENVDTMFYGLFSIPIFPHRMQMVALWEESTNWRVLQASVHADISRSLQIYSHFSRDSVAPLFEDERRQENVFESCADLATTFNLISNTGPLGIVLETVRTFLAEWLVTAARVPDWKPEIPRDKFEFFWPKNLFSISTDFDGSLIYVCLNELQQHVAKTISSDDNLPSNYALTMMLILGFPLIKREALINSTPYVQTSIGNEHNTVSLSDKVHRVSSILAPQNVSVIIRRNIETGLTSLQLENRAEEARFIWQQWVDAALGYMSGLDKREAEKVTPGRTITKPDLNGSMVELCPLHVNENGRVEDTDVARMWKGWPAFDVRICKFEVDQWLSACDVTLDPRDSEPVDPYITGYAEEDLSFRALQVLNNTEKAISQTIMARKNDGQ